MREYPNVATLDRSLFRRDDVQLLQESVALHSVGLRDEENENGPTLLLQHCGFAPPALRPGIPPLLLEELGVVTWQADCFTARIRAISPNVEHVLGYSVSQWLDTDNFWFENLHPADRSEAMAKRSHAVVTGDNILHVYRLHARNDCYIRVRELTRHRRNAAGGTVLQGCWMALDETEIAREIDEENSRDLRETIREMPGLVWTCDKKLRITRSMGSDFMLLNLREEQPRNASLADILEPRDTRRIHVGMHIRALNGESVTYEVQAAFRTYQVVLKPILEPGLRTSGCIGIGVDITERKWAEEKTAALALQDPLTGLANSRHFHETLKQEISRSLRTNRTFALLLLDVDGLKPLNDTHGHLAGSKALCQLAETIRACCRSMDTACRFGGDEFAIILPEANALVANSVAQRIAGALVRSSFQPRFSTSAGVAEFSRDGSDSESLFAAADKALYDNKRIFYESKER